MINTILTLVLCVISSYLYAQVTATLNTDVSLYDKEYKVRAKFKKDEVVTLLDGNREGFTATNGIDTGFVSGRHVYGTEEVNRFYRESIEKAYKKQWEDIDKSIEKEKAERDSLMRKENAEKEALMRKLKSERDAQNRNEEIDREARIRMEFKGSRVEQVQDIIDRKIWIGMTTKMALASRGKPKKINTSVYSWGKHEQWVYSNVYLYFENDILKSYQTSE